MHTRQVLAARPRLLNGLPTGRGMALACSLRMPASNSAPKQVARPSGSRWAGAPRAHQRATLRTAVTTTSLSRRGMRMILAMKMKTVSLANSIVAISEELVPQ